MKKVYEAWEDEENGCIAFNTTEGFVEERSKGLLSPGAKFLFRIEADTWEEALAARNAKLGWDPYIPDGEARSCPRGCGAIFYPEGSGECPNCGRIC